MTQQEYITAFKKELEKILELTTRKNADYADKNDAFLNFRNIENITEGKISIEQGLLVRMSDKMQRIANLLDREAKVSDEKIIDTLEDLAIYSLIMKIYLENKKSSNS